MSWSYNPFTGTLDKSGGSLSGVELLANKATDLSVRNDTLYPTTSATGNGIAAAADNLFELYLYSTAADVATYYVMQEGIPPGGGFGITASSAADGDLIAAFISNTGVPGVTTLYSGVYKLRIQARQLAGTKSSRIYFEIYKRASGGAETLLGTSSESTDLTGSNEEKIVDVVFASKATVLSSDRIVIKIMARVYGSGTDPDVNIDIQGTNFSRFEYPSSILLAANAYTDSVTGSMWNTSGNAGTSGSAVLGTTDLKAWSTIANGIFVDSYATDGTVSSILNLSQGDGVLNYQRRYQTNLIPSAVTTTSSFFNISNYVSVGGTGFDYGGQIVSSSSGFSHGGSEHIGFLGSGSFSSSLSGGGHTDTVKNNDSNINISGPYQIDLLVGASAYINANQLTGYANGLEAGISFLDSVLSGTNGINSNNTIYGTTDVTGQASAINALLQIYDSSHVDFAYGTSSALSIYENSTVDNFYSINSNLQIFDSAQASGGGIGINSAVSVRDSAQVGNITCIQSGMQFEDSSSADYVNGISAYINSNGSSSFQGISSYNDGSTIEGSTSISGSFTAAGIYPQMRGNSSANSFQGINLGVQMSGSASVDNLQPFNLYSNVSGSASVTNSVTLANFGLDSSYSLSGVTGISLNIDNASCSDAMNKYGIQSNGGIYSFTYQLTVPPATSLFMGIHNTNSAMTIASGSPITSLGFINNVAQSLVADDDWGADFTGVRLGWCSIAAVSQASIASGKTIDSYSGIVSGLNDVARAGTIDQAFSFRAVGVIPGGGSVTTNLEVGFQAMPTMGGTSSGNCWAFRDDTSSAENYFGKVAIGTSSKKVLNSSVALEIGSVAGFLGGRVDTAQRLALTAVAGLEVFDTDESKKYYYDGSSWLSVPRGTINFQEDLSSSVDGVNVTFILAHTPTEDFSVNLYVNGLMQYQGSDYTISGDTITFAVAPVSGQSVYASYEYY